MSELTGFLLARIEEDEDAVRVDVRYGDPRGVRVLAECEAKRKIVERCQWADSNTIAANDWEIGVFQDDAESTLRDLAAIYADHPDYRQEWKP